MTTAFENELEAALLESIDPIEPPPVARLLGKAKDVDRLAVFAPQLAKLFGLTEAAARGVLAQAKRREGLVPGPGKGVRFLPVDGIAKCLLFVDADGEFPSHVHPGDETLLVLEGALRDSHGRECWRGESVTLPKGSEHSVMATGGVPCICAVLTDDSGIPPHL